ncbi:P-loop containing nucleoside triphosphate hydrolase protein [Peniophora sp. CONT]|nr:P-loop containing nucleoside triphosphate hydrolase protein [Peniophora sp. CONT]
MHRPARYNAKARGLQKKGKTNKRKEPTEDAPAGLPSQTQAYADANADVMERKSEEEKEADRRLKLRQQMLEESNSRASSKKKKRLDKYIDKKLKKDERLELFEKLAKSQAQLPSTLALQSSSTLGTGRVSTHQARQEQAEDREVRRVMDGTAGSRKRKRGGNTNYSSVVRTGSGSEDEDEELDVVEEGRMDVDEDEEPGHSPTNPVLVIEDSAPPVPERPTSKAVVGGALKRDADGSVAAPKMLARKDKGQRTILQRWKRPSQQQPDFQLPVESDTSFDSSDSANDSSDEEDDASEEGSGDDDEESGEDKSGSGSGEDSDEEEDAPTKRKLGDFKSWAMNQLSAAKGYVAPVPTDAPDDIPPPSLAPPAKKRKLSPPPDGLVHGPLGETLVLPSTSLAQSLQSQSSSKSSSSRKYVSVKRPSDVEEARLLLPIVGEEQPIMEAILLNTVVVICGETGSGKTTQVPQFLYEAGFGSPGSDNPGMIGITQPRRVAAISMSQRVSHELSLSSSIVSYQIRYDATVSPSTSIKFMTDGVLLRELASDFLLIKYSVVVIDEAHERSVNTDILVGVLSRVVRLREEMWKSDGQVKPLRLIIMSATLRVSDFTHNTALFPTPPPVINVSARQHPVTIHFNRRTKPDYVSESIRKTAKIHARLPPGGILIFLTGQNEIMGVCRKLEERYGVRAIEGRRKRRREGVKSRDAQAFFRDEDPVVVRPAQVPLEAEDMELGAALAEDLADDVDGNAETDEEALDTDDDELDEELGIDSEESEVPMHIVPLYSLLPSEKQMKVFEPPPEGHRLVVVSTNVAETSLTIPNIRYVVDCGRAKERKYDLASSVQSFQIGFTSKASASQRAGRAGRTGPGHCYRLYSSALYESYFPSFSEPEILRMPIEGLVLQMKSMHVDTVVNFPFPTAPERGALSRAEKVLTRLGALSSSGGSGGGGGQITDMGRTMALFPLSPRFAKMLASGRQHGCLPYIVAIVAGLSVGDPFLREEAVGEGDGGKEEEVDGDMRHLTGAQARAKEMRRLRRKAFFESQQLHASLGKSTSDMFRLLSVVGAYEYAGGGSEFCAEHFVRPKAMEEIHKLRAQISNIVAVNFPGTDAGFIPNLPPPKDKQLKVLRQLFASGFIDQVAVRKDLVSQDGAGLKHTTSKNVPYRALGVSEDVFIHPSSVLSNTAPPDYIVFHELVRTSRTWIKGLTVVNPAWLASLGAKSGLCTFSKPFKNRAGEELVMPKFGPEGWELPAIKAGSVQ